MCKPFCKGASLKSLYVKQTKLSTIRCFGCDGCKTVFFVERMPFINNDGAQEDIITVTEQTSTLPEIVKRGWW